MRMLGKLVLAAMALSLVAPPAMARSAAAKYLIKQHIQQGCGGRGTFKDIGIIEQDLTGDGKADLILDHGGIDCAGGNRSEECGFRACSVYFYVREGDLLQSKFEILSIGVAVVAGNPPGIGLTGHNFEESTVRWNGKTFD